MGKALHTVPDLKVDTKSGLVHASKIVSECTYPGSKTLKSCSYRGHESSRFRPGRDTHKGPATLVPLASHGDEVNVLATESVESVSRALLSSPEMRKVTPRGGSRDLLSPTALASHGGVVEVIAREPPKGGSSVPLSPSVLASDRSSANVIVQEALRDGRRDL